MPFGTVPATTKHGIHFTRCWGCLGRLAAKASSNVSAEIKPRTEYHSRVTPPASTPSSPVNTTLHGGELIGMNICFQQMWSLHSPLNPACKQPRGNVTAHPVAVACSSTAACVQQARHSLELGLHLLGAAHAQLVERVLRKRGVLNSRCVVGSCASYSW